MTTPSQCDVLIVEDDLSLRRLYVRALVKSGLSVNVAETAQEAISLLGETNYDVLVLDWFLPEGTGAEVLSYVRNCRRLCAKQVTVLTSAEPTALRHVDRSVVKAILFKPLDAEALTSHVLAACGR